jgi:hypothetical protein
MYHKGAVVERAPSGLHLDRRPGRTVGPRLGNSDTLVEEKCGRLTWYHLTCDEDL